MNAQEHWVNDYAPTRPAQVRMPEIIQLMESPSVYALKNFLSPQECDHLISLGADKVRRSTTVDPETGDYIEIEARSSSHTFLTLGQDSTVASVEARMAALVGIPVINGEGLQILRYEVGQEYKPHYDFFDPSKPGSVKALAKGGQRVVTILAYLTDVEEGGETIFPKINLSVRPTRGDGILFYSMYANGDLDWNSLHGSVPVVQGTKWVATKWIRQHPYT